MRDLRFRAFDHSEKFTYFTLDGVTLLNGVKGSLRSCLEQEGWFIMDQSINFKDINGKEIFENDILKTNEADWVGRVSYEGGAFLLVDNKGGYSIMPQWDKCEVIGNNHQHKDLIK